MYPSTSEVDELIRLGGMAPSGGNMQPWKVLVREGTLELSLQDERLGSMLDVGCYASVFAIGSFLENVCVASSWMGWEHEVLVHEFRSPADPIVTIRYLKRTEARDEDSLYEQISRRHTNRHLHQGSAVPGSTIDALRNCIARWPSLRLDALSDEAGKKRAASVLGKGNALLFRHGVLFRELLSELRFSSEEAARSRDGVALSTLELPRSAVLLLRVLRACPALHRVLPRGALERMPEQAIMGCSHLCALSVRGALSTQALVDAGRALQRLWLKATALQLGIQPLATLPFLVLRAQAFAGAGLSRSETSDLKSLGAELKQLYSLEASETPIFIFRLSRPVASASDRALRLPHQALYSEPSRHQPGVPS